MNGNDFIYNNFILILEVEKQLRKASRSEKLPSLEAAYWSLQAPTPKHQPSTRRGTGHCSVQTAKRKRKGNE